MKALSRLVFMLALFGVVVLPLSAQSRFSSDGPSGPQSRHLRPAAARFGGGHGLTKSLTCEIYCSNGDTASKTVETRGGCLDACESFCAEQGPLM